MVRHTQYPTRSFSPQPSEAADDDDVNSPSDGYFSRGSHVPSNLLIPDEDPVTSSSSDKAREASSESQSPTSYRHSEPSQQLPIRNTQPIYTPSTSRASDDGYTESSPLLPEPPPMYEDAMAGRSRPELSSCSVNDYGTNGASSNVGGSSFVPGRLGGGREMQSMADRPPNPVNSEIYDEEAGGRAEALRPKRRGCFGRNKREQSRNRRPKEKKSWFKRFLLFVIGLGCFAWFLGLFVSKTHNDAGSNIGGGGIPLRDPDPPSYTQPTSPHSPEKPEKPSVPKTSPHPVPPPKNPYVDPPDESVPDSDKRRRIVITETSQAVSGTYPLFDLLDISTTSGSISIYIDPQAAPSHAPNRTATLRLRSTSGSVSIMGVAGVHAHSSSSSDAVSFPHRMFETHITTQSGSVSGSFLLGATTEIHTGSGSISVGLSPYSFPSTCNCDCECDEDAATEAPSTLFTSTTGGSTNIMMKPPLNTPTMRNLTATHESQGSGSMNIVYPHVWEGEVDIRSFGSGSITAYGDGLNVLRYGSRHVIGEKGKAEEGSQVRLLSRKSGSTGFFLR